MKERRHEGMLQGKFVEKTTNITHRFSGKWRSNGLLKKDTEGILFAAQEQSLRTNSIKAKNQFYPKCRLCWTKEEQLCIQLVVSPSWRKKQYKRRHEKFIGNWELCKKYGLESSDRWYEHTPAGVVENDEVELYLTIQTDMAVTHNRPDIILVEQAIREWTIVDIAVPGDFNVVRIEDWKVEKYQDLEFEVRRIYHVETAILPVVIGALGTVPTRLIRSIEVLGIGDIIATTQMTSLSGTAGILHRAMNL